MGSILSKTVSEELIGVKRPQVYNSNREAMDCMVREDPCGVFVSPEWGRYKGPWMIEFR